MFDKDFWYNNYAFVPFYWVLAILAILGPIILTGLGIMTLLYLLWRGLLCLL
ncbi:MAG: hypothetical protein RR091_09740 [Cloacibacillus sp.]